METFEPTGVGLGAKPASAYRPSLEGLPHENEFFPPKNEVLPSQNEIFPPRNGGGNPPPIVSKFCSQSSTHEMVSIRGELFRQAFGVVVNDSEYLLHTGGFQGPAEREEKAANLFRDKTNSERISDKVVDRVAERIADICETISHSVKNVPMLLPYDPGCEILNTLDFHIRALHSRSICCFPIYLLLFRKLFDQVWSSFSFAGTSILDLIHKLYYLQQLFHNAGWDPEGDHGQESMVEGVREVCAEDEFAGGKKQEGRDATNKGGHIFCDTFIAQNEKWLRCRALFPLVLRPSSFPSYLSVDQEDLLNLMGIHLSPDQEIELKDSSLPQNSIANPPHITHLSSPHPPENICPTLSPPSLHSPLPYASTPISQDPPPTPRQVVYVLKLQICALEILDATAGQLVRPDSSANWVFAFHFFKVASAVDLNDLEIYFTDVFQPILQFFRKGTSFEEPLTVMPSENLVDNPVPNIAQRSSKVVKKSLRNPDMEAHLAKAGPRLPEGFFEKVAKQGGPRDNAGEAFRRNTKLSKEDEMRPDLPGKDIAGNKIDDVRGDINREGKFLKTEERLYRGFSNGEENRVSRRERVPSFRKDVHMKLMQDSIMKGKSTYELDEFRIWTEEGIRFLANLSNEEISTCLSQAPLHVLDSLLSRMFSVLNTVQDGSISAKEKSLLVPQKDSKMPASAVPAECLPHNKLSGVVRSAGKKLHDFKRSLARSESPKDNSPANFLVCETLAPVSEGPSLGGKSSSRATSTVLEEFISCSMHPRIPRGASFSEGKSLVGGEGGNVQNMGSKKVQPSYSFCSTQADSTLMSPRANYYSAGHYNDERESLNFSGKYSCGELECANLDAQRMERPRLAVEQNEARQYFLQNEARQDFSQKEAGQYFSQKRNPSHLPDKPNARRRLIISEEHNGNDEQDVTSPQNMEHEALQLHPHSEKGEIIRTFGRRNLEICRDRSPRFGDISAALPVMRGDGKMRAESEEELYVNWKYGVQKCVKRSDGADFGVSTCGSGAWGRESASLFDSRNSGFENYVALSNQTTDHSHTPAYLVISKLGIPEENNNGTKKPLSASDIARILEVSHGLTDPGPKLSSEIAKLPFTDFKCDVRGVYYHRRNQCWCVHWTSGKKERCKSFRVPKYGFFVAKTLAVDCRRQIEKSGTANVKNISAETASSIKGVYFRKGAGHYKMGVWVAFWTHRESRNARSKRSFKTFSVADYGYEEAKKRATVCRTTNQQNCDALFQKTATLRSEKNDQNLHQTMKNDQNLPNNENSHPNRHHDQYTQAYPPKSQTTSSSPEHKQENLQYFEPVNFEKFSNEKLLSLNKEIQNVFPHIPTDPQLPNSPTNNEKLTKNPNSRDITKDIAKDIAEDSRADIATDPRWGGRTHYAKRQISGMSQIYGQQTSSLYEPPNSGTSLKFRTVHRLNSVLNNTANNILNCPTINTLQNNPIHPTPDHTLNITINHAANTNRNTNPNISNDTMLNNRNIHRTQNIHNLDNPTFFQKNTWASEKHHTNLPSPKLTQPSQTLSDSFPPMMPA